MEYSVGGNVFGNWRITRELGQGTYGKVFEINKNEFGVSISSALKVMTIPHSPMDVKAAMSEGMDFDSVSCYYQGVVRKVLGEIQTMSSFKGCENVVHYEDHCVITHEKTIGWDVLIRMELLTPLIDYLSTHSMSEQEVLKLGIDLTKAVEFCHERGVVHRDIKPENVFVNEAGTYKLGDFGESRTMEKTIGATKRGTESYMAPEVYLGREYNKNVDIYSLGIMLYRLMNGNRLPFYPLPPQPISFSDREVALDRRLKGEKFAAPVNASEKFASIIMKASAYDPRNRYGTAGEMLEDLYELRDRYIINRTGTNQHAEDTFGAYEQTERTTGIFGMPGEDRSSQNPDYRKQAGATTETVDVTDDFIKTEGAERTTGVFGNPTDFAHREETERTSGIFGNPTDFAHREETERTSGIFGDPTDFARQQQEERTAGSYETPPQFQRQQEASQNARTGFNAAEFWRNRIAKIKPQGAKMAGYYHQIMLAPYISPIIMGKMEKNILKGRAPAGDVIGVITLAMDKKRAYSNDASGVVFTKDRIFFQTGASNDYSALGAFLALAPVVLAASAINAKKNTRKMMLFYRDIRSVGYQKNLLNLELKDGTKVCVDMTSAYSAQGLAEALNELLQYDLDDGAVTMVQSTF